MGQYRLEILSPSRRLFAGTVDSVTFETWDGFMQVFAGHESIVVPVKPCLARIAGGGERSVAILAEGFATITGEKVELFVDSAEWPEEIDLERAERALARAEERLRTENLSWMVRRSKSAAARAKARIAGHALRAAAKPPASQ